jgi:hypothetical protein
LWIQSIVYTSGGTVALTGFLGVICAVPQLLFTHMHVI